MENGHNLDAFNDLLRGGFGAHEYEESIKITWENSEKSKIDFGFPTTVQYLQSKLERCHPSNTDYVKADMELAKQGKGKTLFDLLIEIIREHKHIEFSLK